MSSKSSKGPKKVSLATAEPRDLESIQKEYQQAAFELGQLEYQIFASESQAEELKKRILNLNQEAFARKEKDAKAEPKKEETNEVA